MLVRDIMSTCIAECTEDTPIERVYESMQKCGHNAVVVIESKYHRLPIGIVTEHTICQQVIGRGRSTNGLLAANVMTSKITKVSGSSSVGLCPAAAEQDPSLPLIVVDEHRNLCGLLPKDVLRLARAEMVIHHTSTPAAAAVDSAPLSGWTH